MPDLEFSVISAEAVTFAASPLLSFKLGIRNRNREEIIQSVALRCQIQIEPTRRRYSAAEQTNLFELFDDPKRWGRTLTSMLWTHASTTVPAFKCETVVDLPVPCTFDFNIAATKYFEGLEDGVVPLNLMFSGTIFFDGPLGLLVEQISWEKEARFNLPVRVWRDMMNHYYPNIVWLCLRRDVFEELRRYKMENAIPTWEQVFDNIVPAAKKHKEPAKKRKEKEDELTIEVDLPS
jgi:uncharacterized protein DUF6084